MITIYIVDGTSHQSSYISRETVRYKYDFFCDYQIEC